MTATAIMFTEKSSGDSFFADDVDNLLREDFKTQSDRHLFLNHWFDYLTEGVESGRTLPQLTEIFSDSADLGPIFNWINNRFSLATN